MERPISHRHNQIAKGQWVQRRWAREWILNCSRIVSCHLSRRMALCFGSDSGLGSQRRGGELMVLFITSLSVTSVDQRISTPTSMVYGILKGRCNRATDTLNGGKGGQGNKTQIFYLPPFPRTPLGSSVINEKLEVISKTIQRCQRADRSGDTVPLPCGHLNSKLSSLRTLSSLAPILPSGSCH